MRRWGAMLALPLAAACGSSGGGGGSGGAAPLPAALAVAGTYDTTVRVVTNRCEPNPALRFEGATSNATSTFGPEGRALAVGIDVATIPLPAVNVATTAVTYDEGTEILRFGPLSLFVQVSTGCIVHLQPEGILDFDLAAGTFDGSLDGDGSPVDVPGAGDCGAVPDPCRLELDVEGARRAAP